MIETQLLTNDLKAIWDQILLLSYDALVIFQLRLCDRMYEIQKLDDEITMDANGLKLHMGKFTKFAGKDIQIMLVNSLKSN